MTATLTLDAPIQPRIESPTVVSVQGLDVSFTDASRRKREVVQKISFDLRAGECLAIVGESGSGKSVTARTLVGLTGAGAEVTAEQLQINGQGVRSLTQRQWRELRGNKIGFVSQDALVALDPFQKVGSEVGQALKIHTELEPKQRQKRVLATLAAVGVPHPELRAQQRPFELSGGLRQRAVIASALITSPALLIADEPTTALDVTLQKQILDLLKLAKEDGTAVLLVSHDLAVVNELADRVLVMKDGQIVETGPVEKVLRQPQHAYTQRLRDAVPTPQTRGHRLAPHLPTQLGDLPAARLRERPNEPLLTAANLTKTYKMPAGGRLTAVRDVSLQVLPGQTLGIVGESGSGKSTTARILAGLEIADSGEVHVLGEKWSSLSRRKKQELRKHIGFIYQDPLSSFDPRWSVEKILIDAIGFTGISNMKSRERARELLSIVGLESSVTDRHPLHLSGGQRQRVAIARALATTPEIIICDEPVSALDVSVQATILDLLTDLQEALGIAYVFISHDLGVVHHLADELIVMKDAAIVERGNAVEVFTQPEHPYTQKLLTALPAFA